MECMSIQMSISLISIISEREIDREKQYLIFWHGYTEDDNTWEPIENVAETEALQIWNNQRSPCTLLVNSTLLDDPATYKDVLSEPDADMWQSAINDELTSINDNNTWTIIP